MRKVGKRKSGGGGRGSDERDDQGKEGDIGGRRL